VDDLARGPTREKAIAHWRKVQETTGLPPISYEFARAALAVLGGEGGAHELLERAPGEDG